MDFVGKSVSFSQYIGWIITPTVPVWQDNFSLFGKFFQKRVSRDEVFPLNIACFPDMYFLPSSVLTTGTFCHFLTNCLPAVPSSGGIPSRPAFVPGGQLSADRPFSIGNVPPPAHCSQQQFFFMSPTGNFLSIAKESHQRTPAETNGFCTSFAVCKSCILNPAEAGNRLPPTHAAATLGS